MHDVIGAPGDAAGEVGDLDRGFAVELALHVPVEHLRLVVREGGVEHVELVGVREELQFDRTGIDQRVGPGELQRVDALLERDDARFADQREVFAVVDRELHRVPLGHRRQIDVAGDASPSGDDDRQQYAQGGNCFAHWFHGSYLMNCLIAT